MIDVTELKALPENTTIYCIYRKTSRAGATKTYDVFFIADNQPTVSNPEKAYLAWIKLDSEQLQDWRKMTSIRAATSIDEDNKLDGTFQVRWGNHDDLVRAIEVFCGIKRGYFHARAI